MNEVLSKEFRYPTLTSKKKRWYWTIKCEKCGEIVEKVYQKSTWNFMCNACGKGRFTKADFVKKATSVHGDIYSYDNVNYTNNDTKIAITCKQHGDWLVRPSDFLSGGNCPKCSKTKVSKKLENTIEEWQAQLVNPLVTIISKNSKEFGTFKCSEHGEYNARFSLAVKSPSSGCVVCNRLLHRSQPVHQHFIDTTATIYWVYVPRIDMYKLGCTTQPIQERFKSEKDLKTIWTKAMLYQDAIELEHVAHSTLTHLRYKGELQLLKDGTYECYHNNYFPSYNFLIQRLSECQIKDLDLKKQRQ